MRAIGQAHRSACARNFFHGHHVRQIAHGRTAVFFFNGNAQHTELAHLAPQVHWELVIAVDGSCARRDFGLRESMHRVAQRIHVFA